MNIPSIQILNVRINTITMRETLAWATHHLRAADTLAQICTVNPEFVMKAQDDPAFMYLLTQTALNLPDGVGLLLAARLQNASLRERVAGSELVYHLAELCAREGKRLFLLGAAQGVAAQAGDIFQHKYPSLEIAGTYSGSPDASENAAIVEKINASRADVLFVAYGAPRQDKWIFRNREKFETVRLAVGVGGSLDFVTGKARRAPRWIQRMGLEWLHRLMLEPWRWRRMLALPRFVEAVVRDRLRSSS